MTLNEFREKHSYLLFDTHNSRSLTGWVKRDLPHPPLFFFNKVSRIAND